MHLECASVELKNDSRLKDYSFLKNGSVITYSKCSLAKIPGLITSYEEDIFMANEEGEACAVMPCGHRVAQESMTLFLRSLI